MRVHRWVVALVSRLVPRHLRDDWRAEWDAELHHEEAAMAQWPDARRGRASLVRRASGALWDALWLQSNQWDSLRLFRRHWRLALSAIVSLGAALAATTVGLSAYNALLFRSPGVGDPRGLRLIHVRTADDPFGAASYPEFEDYRAQSRAFADIAAYPFSISSLSLRVGDRQAQIVATQVSNNFFSVLGVAPTLGMLTFRASPTNDVHDVVLSEALWKRLGASPALVGSTVHVNDHAVTVAGVVPSRYRGMTWGFEPELWMSLKTSRYLFESNDREFTDRTLQTLHMVGRLKPGVTPAQAEADVARVAAAVTLQQPKTNQGRFAGLTPIAVTPPGDRTWMMTLLGALMAVVLLILAVAGANVTNLLLGLTTVRRHEMLVRAALGASRLQLVMPLLRETAALGLVSGVVGYGAAWIGLEKLAQFKPSLGGFLPSLSIDIRPDALVALATLSLAVLAGLAIGAAPALRGADEGLSGAINREFMIGEPRKARLRNGLVAVQMAVASLVLVGVGVSIHSLLNLRHVPLGFSARNLVFGGVDMKRSGYTAETGPAFYERMRERLLATPGIEAITFADNPPLAGSAVDRVVAEGDPPPADGHGAETPYAVVDHAYFSTLGMGLLQGRTFDSRDRPGRPEVIVVNATLARRHWPGRNALGRRLVIENGHRLVEVIGVVPDGKYNEIDEAPLPFMYFALAQHYLPDITVVARTNGPRDIVIKALADMDDRIAFGGIGPMAFDDMLGLSMLLPKAIVWTTLAFGVLALVLAVFGLYSTVYYAVSQRRMEMGIRTTLGATPRHLFVLAMKQTGWAGLAGAASGLGVSLLVLPVASSLFFGIGPVEPLVLLVVALTSTLVALVTTYFVVRPWTAVAAINLLRR